MDILGAIRTFSNPRTLQLYLSAIPIRKYKTIDGWLSLNEAYTLYKYARMLPFNSTVVEIGSWKGKSTYCLAKGIRSGTIYAIDPFNSDGETGSKEVYQERAMNTDLLSEFNSNMASRGVTEKVKPKKGYSSDFVTEFSAIDFLFIDGDHSIDGAAFDFNQFGPLLKAGGFIAFHDYDSKRPDFGPTYVVENLVKKSGNYQMIGLFDTLWLARKQ